MGCASSKAASAAAGVAATSAPVAAPAQAPAEAPALEDDDFEDLTEDVSIIDGQLKFPFHVIVSAAVKVQAWQRGKLARRQLAQANGAGATRV